MFKLDNFGVILFVSFSYKNCYNVHFMKILKNWCKNRFFCKKFKKACVLQRRACNKIQNFQMQLSRNYNDSEHAIKQKMLHFSWSFRIYHFFIWLLITGLVFNVIAYWPMYRGQYGEKQEVKKPENFDYVISGWPL